MADSGDRGNGQSGQARLVELFPDADPTAISPAPASTWSMVRTPLRVAALLVAFHMTAVTVQPAWLPGGEHVESVADAILTTLQGIVPVLSQYLIPALLAWAGFTLAGRRGSLVERYAAARGLEHAAQGTWDRLEVPFGRRGITRTYAHEASGRIGHLHARLVQLTSSRSVGQDANVWTCWVAQTRIEDAQLPGMSCRRRTLSTRIDDLMRLTQFSQRVETGHAAFDERYVLDVADGAGEEARALLDVTFRRAMLELPPQVEWQVSGSDVAVYTGGGWISERELDTLARSLCTLTKLLESRLEKIHGRTDRQRSHPGSERRAS